LLENMPAKRKRGLPTSSQASLLPFEKFAVPDLSIAAVFSFLKDTRGLTTWTPDDLAKTLKIGRSDANRVIEILELQGYVKPAESTGDWLTTIAGETVSGSATPRFTADSVESALESLTERIAEFNRAHGSAFKIIQAVAFGDFLAGRARAQAADVGILLEPKKLRAEGSASLRRAPSEVLRRLRARSAAVRLLAYENWMTRRTHRDLL
jgi:DNA-binding MarR family transcriptional regulator